MYVGQLECGDAFVLQFSLQSGCNHAKTTGLPQSVTLVRPCVNLGRKAGFICAPAYNSRRRCLHVFKQWQQGRAHNLSSVFQQDLTAGLEAQKYIFIK